MKKIVFLLFVLSASNSYGQQIEAIQTPTDALNFIQSLNTHYKQYVKLEGQAPRYKNIYCIVDSNIRTTPMAAFQKYDFDNNGKIDLLFNGINQGGSFSVVVLDNGNEDYLIRDLLLSKYDRTCFSSEIVSKDNHTIVKVYTLQYILDPLTKMYKGIPYVINLKYTEGYFIEDSSESVNSFERIDFSYLPGLSMDVIIYKFTITADGNAILSCSANGMKEAIIDSGGIFTTVIPITYQHKLRTILSQLPLNFHEKAYEINAPCEADSKLNILLSDGKKILITDHGLCGNYGLRALYSVLFEIKAYSTWKKMQY